MMRYLFLLIFAAMAVVIQPQKTALRVQADLANPSRITVVTKNSEYPRLNRNDAAAQSFAQGQWI